MNFSMAKDVKWTHGSAASGAATTDVDTGVLDMAGFDGVFAVADLGDVTNTCVLRLSLWGNTASSTSSPTPVAVVTSAQFTADASTGDSKVLVADCPKWDHTYRYCFARLERDTANAVLDGIALGQYHPRTLPVTQVDAIIAGFGAN